MKLGFCKVNITPPILTCSNGGMFDSPEDFHLGVHDELYARALVLNDAGMEVAIVSVDLINLPRHSVEIIKSRIKDQSGIPPGNIILHALHPHSGPFSYRFRQGIRNDAYWEVTEQKIAGAVYMAQQATQECMIGAGRSQLDYTLNRRVLQEDGTVLYLSKHPGLVPNGPVDPEVGVISFRKLDKRPLVTLVNYTCHPMTVGPVPRMISADYPGATVKELEARLFGSAICTNGASGNIHPKQHCQGFEAMEDMGRALADKVVETVPFIKPSKPQSLKILREEIVLDLIPQQIDRNEDISQYHRDETYDFEITTLAIDNIALVAIPAEYFVELQLEIKKRSPFDYTYLLTTSNGYTSYIPDEKAYDQGGYEVDSAKFVPGSGERIMEQILEMLNRLGQ